MRTRTPRSKRFARGLLAALGVAALGACTPQAYIEQVFGPASGEATRVAQCESGLNPEARSAGGGNHGLFQINNVHRGTFEQVTGQPWSEVYHPYFNTAFAKWLYDQQGWRPWTCKP
jgi:hypothetical protein